MADIPPPVSPVPSTSPARGLAIGALVAGGVAFLIGLVPFLGLIVAAAAIVLGVIALRKGQSKPFSLIGIGLGSIAALASLIMTIVMIAGMANPQPPVAAPATTAPAVETTTAAPEPAPPSPEPTTEEPAPTTVEPTTAAPETTEPPAPAESVAARVEAAVLDGLVADDYMSACLEGISWACAITEVKDGAVAGNVEVYVQNPLTKDEATKVARGFVNFSCQAVPEMEWIIVYDLTGGVRAQMNRGASGICA